MEDMFSALRHPAQKESKERLFKMAINKLAPDEKKMLYNILLDELNSNNTN